MHNSSEFVTAKELAPGNQFTAKSLTSSASRPGAFKTAAYATQDDACASVDEHWRTSRRLNGRN
jgi:hypothetical protein